MNVFYSLIKMKATFSNIIICLVCCQCLILHSSATENSAVSATEQTIQLNGTETGIQKSSVINFTALDSQKIISFNQMTAEENSSRNGTNEAKSEIKLSMISAISHDTTESSKENTTINVNIKADKISEKEQSAKTINPAPNAETEASAIAASSPSPGEEEKPSSNVRDVGFDGPSFIGGIVLAVGMIGFGYVAYKFCFKRNLNYRNV